MSISSKHNEADRLILIKTKTLHIDRTFLMLQFIHYCYVVLPINSHDSCYVILFLQNQDAKYQVYHIECPTNTNRSTLCDLNLVWVSVVENCDRYEGPCIYMSVREIYVLKR